MMSVYVRVVCLCMYMCVVCYLRACMFVCLCVLVFVRPCMHGWMDGWMNGWMDVRICMRVCTAQETYRKSQMAFEYWNMPP